MLKRPGLATTTAAAAGFTFIVVAAISNSLRGALALASVAAFDTAFGINYDRFLDALLIYAVPAHAEAGAAFDAVFIVDYGIPVF